MADGLAGNLTCCGCQLIPAWQREAEGAVHSSPIAPSESPSHYYHWGHGGETVFHWRKNLWKWQEWNHTLQITGEILGHPP